MVSPEYKIKFKKRYLKSLTLIAAYSESKNNLSKDLQIPETWDRENFTLASLFKLNKTLSFLAEYTFQLEDTGVASVDNDGYLLQLRMKI